MDEALDGILLLVYIMIVTSKAISTFSYVCTCCLFLRMTHGRKGRNEKTSGSQDGRVIVPGILSLIFF